MSRDVIKSLWPRLSGKLRAKWGKLTYEDVCYADGNRDYLVDLLQKRYAITKDAASRQVTQFERLVT
jgi:uncharacterized protein YjbJ (UPF0337 family)